jgi:hypothetical protein
MPIVCTTVLYFYRKIINYLLPHASLSYIEVKEVWTGMILYIAPSTTTQ